MIRNALIATALVIGSQALADLQVFPTRVLLSDKRRVANISLRHLGKKAGVYRVSAVFYRMKPDGALEVVSDPKPEERPLTKWLRFSPRVVTLEPNVEQVVKVMFSGAANLADGEYRAHLHFEPSDDNEDNLTVGAGNTGKINMQLQAKVAVAIPVVFRHGQPSYKVKLSNLSVGRLPNGQAGFRLEMDTTGNAFPYGDFFAFFYPKEGAPQNIGIVRGVASYLPHRVVQYPLTIPDSVKLAHGSVRLEYRMPASPEEKSEKKDDKPIDTVEFAIP